MGIVQLTMIKICLFSRSRNFGQRYFNITEDENRNINDFYKKMQIYLVILRILTIFTSRKCCLMWRIQFCSDNISYSDCYKTVIFTTLF